MYKILVCDPIADSAIRILKESPDVELLQAFNSDQSVIKEMLADVNAVIVRSATILTQELIESAGNLKVIGRAGSGLDNVDTACAARKGIRVLNTPGTNAPAVAELTIGFLFALARHIPAMDEALKKGEWAKKGYSGSELRGKTLGLVGCGGIGKLVARSAAALGMQILIANRSTVLIDNLEFEQLPLEKLLGRCDYISVHLPKNEKTAGLINTEAFCEMKQGACLINTSRGGIVNEKALLTALKNGNISGAAIDVFEKEPDYNKELAALPNVIATPHIGAASKESQERVGIQIVDSVLEYLRSRYIFI